MKQPVPVAIYRTKRPAIEGVGIVIGTIIVLAASAYCTQYALGILGQHVTYWESVVINVAVWMVRKPEDFMPWVDN